jgi:carboxyl-terminal processing protease
LPNGVGYIHLNVFLDPVSVMPDLESAIRSFSEAPGIVLDLRNNPGGLGIMAMGMAGWFVTDEDARLGSMKGRDLNMDFEINAREGAYEGHLAILVNGGSASTSEILAQGLRDLQRARIFGTKTAGAALPSAIVELPNGDRFEYPEANYTSLKGRILEGNGVEPDVVVAPTIEALREGRDLPLEAAAAWCAQAVHK